jgi:hypothetical protein
MRPQFFLITVLALLVLTACGGSTTPAPSTGSDSEAVNITLDTNPDPPAPGQVELIVMLTDSAGQAIDTAEVNLLASHTGHSGMEMNGEATAQGDGRYAITADFSMSGTWLVTVEVRGLSDEVIRKNFELGLK